MSARIETLIFCDGDNCPENQPYAAGDARELSAKRQRARYGCDGWKYIKGKDYCPQCVERISGAKERTKWET